MPTPGSTLGPESERVGMDSGQARARMPPVMGTEARPSPTVAGHSNRNAVIPPCVVQLPHPGPAVLSARSASPAHCHRLFYLSVPGASPSAPSGAFLIIPVFIRYLFPTTSQSAGASVSASCFPWADGHLQVQLPAHPGASLNSALGCLCAIRGVHSPRVQGSPRSRCKTWITGR